MKFWKKKFEKVQFVDQKHFSFLKKYSKTIGQHQIWALPAEARRNKEARPASQPSNFLGFQFINFEVLFVFLFLGFQFLDFVGFEMFWIIGFKVSWFRHFEASNIQ